MRRILSKLFLLVLLATAMGSWNLAAFAAEEAAPAAKPEGGDSKSAKGEDGEGGDKKKSGDNEVSGGRFAGDPIYVHISPLLMPIISDQGLEQIVTIIIDVEVKDVDVADNMHTNMPKVRDSLMRALYGGLGQGGLRNGKLIDVRKIKVKCAAALDEVVGEGNIRNVLIQDVAQRML